VGYSESSAGTDTAAIKTSARLDGDHYVVNGQKIYTSGVHAADYVWLSCRTSEEQKKHRGLTILIVDTTSAGFSTTPMATINGARAINATYSRPS
jgi:alkylation response protein AidB-like acyl-CoA dehydrogenase